MLKSIAVLLTCQLIGEALARGLALPVPGPVIGLVLLFLLLLWRGTVADGILDARPQGMLGGTADRILAMLGLLFVPAGVGLIDHLGLVESNLLGFGVVLLASVVVTLTVTVLAFLGVEWLMRRGDRS